MERFTAEIKKQKDLDGAYVEIPFDVESVFGKKRVKVKARFDGVEYRGSIVRMGGCFMIGLTKSIRQSIGKSTGEWVEVEVEKDEDERVTELPEDFGGALGENAQAGEFFNKLSFTHKKEYIQWVTSAKKEETRKARIEKAIKMLEENRKLK